MKRDTIIYEGLNKLYSRSIETLLRKTFPNTTFSDYHLGHCQTPPTCLRGRRRPNMGFADRGPTPGAGSHPEQELSHASLGRVRAGQGRNADNTTLGTMVTRTRSMQSTLHADCRVCCSVGCRADNIYTCVCARIFCSRQQHTSCKQCSCMLNMGRGHLFVVCLRCGLFSNVSSA